MKPVVSGGSPSTALWFMPVKFRPTMGVAVALAAARTAARPARYEARADNGDEIFCRCILSSRVASCRAGDARQWFEDHTTSCTNLRGSRSRKGDGFSRLGSFGYHRIVPEKV